MISFKFVVTFVNDVDVATDDDTTMTTCKCNKMNVKRVENNIGKCGLRLMQQESVCLRM